MKYFLLLALSLVGCSTQDQRNFSNVANDIGVDEVTNFNGKKGVDPELLPLVNSFEAAYGKSIGDLPVRFGSTGSDTNLGVCKVRIDGRKEILVSRPFWELYKTNNPMLLEPALWHELGHCVLNRNHTTAKTVITSPQWGELEVPASIMYPKAMWYNYSEFRNHYTSELFQRPMALDDEEETDLHDNDGCVIFE